MIRIVDWDKLQHYKNRNPPWVKLHRDWLDDKRFIDLPEDERYLLWGLFLLAGMLDNDIPPSPDWIAKKLHFTHASNVASGLLHLEDQGLIEIASEIASTDACLRVQSTEKRVSSTSGSSSQRSATDSPDPTARCLPRARGSGSERFEATEEFEQACTELQEGIRSAGMGEMTPYELDQVVTALLNCSDNGDLLPTVRALPGWLQKGGKNLGYVIKGAGPANYLARWVEGQRNPSLSGAEKAIAKWEARQKND